MADIIRIRRRVSPGSPGAPGSLQNAELAYNENDHTLYIGEGTGGGGGSASVIVPIGGQGIGSSSTPLMDGTAAVGSANTYARGDHIHPTDTSRAPLNSPAFTGSPTAPTPTPGTDNSTKLATTAFVQSAISAVSAGVTSIAVQDGLSTSGSSGAITLGITLNGIVNSRLAQVPAHSYLGNNTGASASPSYVTAAQLMTDLGAAPINSPTFTGVPAGPTPANGTNTTQFATTAYVLATRLDQFVAPNVDVSWNNHKITGLLDPTGAQDAATKSYVDNTAQGLDTKGSVRAATTANISLTGAQTVDGVALIAGDRVLVKDQTTQSQNGVWVVAAGAWTRATDADIWNELVSAYTFVESGTANADTGWTCTSDPGGTIGSTAVTWAQFSGAGQVTAGAGLTKTGSSIDAIGTAGRILVNADSIDIDPAYVGQSSITTLGTVGTGTWNASTIVVAKGGTGVVTLAAGYVKASGTSPFTSAATIPNTDISGLGTMSTQNANAVAITGGTIDNVTLDGGTF